MRRGVSEVFVNLARRNQVLLHRQLTLLDTMERRTEDADELADLFKLDHMTTRMRRHAEGLVILSGATPSRQWRKPVQLMDVVRAAVAEVEDYERIEVRRLPRLAVDGSAVADLTHLVAELLENATVFSPPHTAVQVLGERVANGFTLEIHDRGLGMTAEAMLDANLRLAETPEFELSDTDRLGLFVVSRLAQRQGVRVSLQPSPYGGTTAVVLIPGAVLTETPGRDDESRGDRAAVGAGAGTARPLDGPVVLEAPLEDGSRSGRESGPRKLPRGPEAPAAAPGGGAAPAGAGRGRARLPRGLPRGFRGCPGLRWRRGLPHRRGRRRGRRPQTPAPAPAGCPGPGLRQRAHRRPGPAAPRPSAPRAAAPRRCRGARSPAPLRARRRTGRPPDRRPRRRRPTPAPARTPRASRGVPRVRGRPPGPTAPPSGRTARRRRPAPAPVAPPDARTAPARRVRRPGERAPSPNAPAGCPAGCARPASHRSSKGTHRRSTPVCRSRGRNPRNPARRRSPTATPTKCAARWHPSSAAGNAADARANRRTRRGSQHQEQHREGTVDDRTRHRIAPGWER